MNNQFKKPYGGLNPIYESLISSVNEDKDKKPVAVDAIGTVVNIMNTFFSILMNSRMENAKTVRGFQEVKNKILECKSMGALRQYLISSLESFKALDKVQKEAYDKNIRYVMDSFASVEQTLADPKIFDSTKKDTVTKILNNFEEDLKQRESQMKKTNPTLFNEVVKKGLVVKESTQDSETTDVEAGEERGKAFNKSKESLDASSAFVGMIDRDKYNPALKDNADVKRYEKIASDLYKKAQDLQMVDRKGIKNIITPSGEIKRRDYLRQQDSLINEIIRQKKEYTRVKDGVLKNAGVSNVIAPPVESVCPPDHVFDIASGGCIPVKKQEEVKPTPTPVKTKDCTFPVTLNTKCSQIGEIQSKLMVIAPSVKSYLSKKGGSDNVYGKGTATVCNIIWGYLSNNSGQSLTGDLTKEMYDGIMALTENDIDTSTATVLGAIKDNRSEEISIDLKIQEMENVKESSVLSFEDFYSVIEESYYFSRMDEETPAAIGSGVKNDLGKNLPKKIKDSCIKDSIAQGKVVPCDGSTDTKKDDEEKKEEEKILPTRDEWKGIKYPETGTYPVAFDESLLSAWAKEVALTAISFAIPGSGYLAKAGTSSLKAIANRGVAMTAKEFAKKVSAKSLASWNSKQAAKWFAKYKTIPIIGRTSAGLIGGTVGSGVADFISGRNSFIITVVDGYIERNNLLGMVGGLVDTLDGYVSDEDLACIATVLSVVKGSWTISNDGTPISAWGEIKKLYLQQEGEDLSADINSISSKMGDVEGFPSIKANNPLVKTSDIPWGSALAEVKDFVAKLDANEAAIKQNISKLPADYVKAHEEGAYEDVTPEELASGKKSDSKDTEDELEVEETE